MEMQPLESFDKKTVTVLSDMLISMMKSVASKFGVTVQPERSRYTPGKFTFTVSFIIRGVSGAPVDFSDKARRIGAPADLWGKKFLFRMQVYTVSDIKAQNRKYPVIATRDHDGASFKFPVKTITDNLQD